MGFLTDGAFLWALENCCATSFWTHAFQWETCCYLNYFFPVSYVSFLLLLFRFFPLFLVFKSLTILCVGMTFFRFILFVICLASESLGLCLLSNSVSFHHNFFSTTAFFSPSRTLMTQLSSFVRVWRFLRPFIFKVWCCSIFECIYFWPHWVFVAAHGLPLVAVLKGHPLLRCVGFSLRWRLLFRSTGSRCVGFRSCGSQA